MSKFYTALVSNEGLDAIRSDFKILIKADSLAQARVGAAARIITVERATDSEIFEAGRNGNVVLNLSDAPTDTDQQSLPFIGVDPAIDGNDTTVFVDMTQPSAHDGTVERDPLLIGETRSGSAPAWLPRNEPATETGD